MHHGSLTAQVSFRLPLIAHSLGRGPAYHLLSDVLSQHGGPAVDLEAAEHAPPGHHAIDQQDSRGKERNPAGEDADGAVHPRIVGYDSACRYNALESGIVT